MKPYAMFIDGHFVRHAGPMIPVINPATEEVVSEVPAGGPEHVEAAVTAAERAQKAWAKRPAVERAGYLRELAQAIRRKADPLARTIVEEQGKVLPLAKIEVLFTADYLDYMAEFARRYEGEIIQSDRPNENILLFKLPLGVIAGILPWNFPFFLIARKLAPALVTGNTIVIKPSSETPNNAFEFAAIVAESSLPKGVFNLVSGTGRRGRPRPCRSPPNRDGQLHGQRGGGRPDHAGGRGQRHQGVELELREGPGHRHARCRPGSGGSGHLCLADHQHRPGVQLRRARVRPRDRRGCVRHEDRGGHAGDPLR